MVKEILKNLGLTTNEVEVYLTLLNKGELSVNEIGMKSGLHRQVCYDALDRLLEKGFVSYILKDGKKFFKALTPEKILDYLEEKKQEFANILPQLNKMFLVEKEDTEVDVIKGKNILRTMLNDTIKTLIEKKDTLYVLGVEEEKYLEADRIAIKQYINKLQKYKLKEKLLAKESAKTFFEGSQSEYRLIPDKFFNPNPTHIYGDKVSIIIWGRPNYCIIIKNKQVADSYRKYFQMLWNMAKKRIRKKTF
ncbi:TPA: hypothetical protein HA246_07090 [Candidatus Woesearchaeota archaeon]|nr:hypothetical protein [Candidatus Woesearchaeota archaeon]